MYIVMITKTFYSKKNNLFQLNIIHLLLFFKDQAIFLNLIYTNFQIYIILKYEKKMY